MRDEEAPTLNGWSEVCPGFWSKPMGYGKVDAFIQRPVTKSHYSCWLSFGGGLSLDPLRADTLLDAMEKADHAYAQVQSVVAPEGSL